MVELSSRGAEQGREMVEEKQECWNCTHKGEECIWPGKFFVKYW